jgi:hypothetical protein
MPFKEALQIRKARHTQEAAEAMAQYEQAQKASHEQLALLREARLAREAARRNLDKDPSETKAR